MNWLAISIVAYFLLALEVVLDKFLLSSKRISHPAIYTFYAGFLGLFVLVFTPFGFHLIAASDIAYRFISGAVFVYGMFFLFSAISKSEASRVVPVTGSIVPMASLILSAIFLNERLSFVHILGILLLVIGGLWISYDINSLKKSKLFEGFNHSIIAGILLAISAVIFKSFYNRDNFIDVFVWTRVGGFIGALSFFLIPSWRRAIISSLFKFKKPQGEHKSSGFMFILVRAIGGAGSILKEKATSFIPASVTIINALVSIEYVFVFVLGVLFSLWLPNIFEEKKDWKSVGQKIVAIVIITCGLFLVAKK
ncbi:MAG TPA: EamA family transporter [Patescibacteria group bacterium]|nr:EamA family transporter [Patescibacteria group bacterium]